MTQIKIKGTLFTLVVQNNAKPIHIENSMLKRGGGLWYIPRSGWLSLAMVLGSFQCRGVLLLWHMVGQGPAVLAAGAG